MSVKLHASRSNTSPIRSRAFCYTLNNPLPGWELGFNLLSYSYHVYGKEVAPTTGTPHIQGYLYFKTMKTFHVLLSSLPSGIHLECAKGRPDQNIVYCTKGGDYVEDGVRPMSQKEKGDANSKRWADAVLAAKEGRFDDLPPDIQLRYMRNCKEIYKDNMPKPTDLDVLDHHWFYGPPGTGKSLTAREKYPGYYLKMSNKWWDGYQGEDNVIIDDVEIDAKYLAHFLKIWADHYPFIAETKGGVKYIRPKRIIITSNYTIDEIFGDIPIVSEAIKRRYKSTHFTELYIK